MKTPMKIPMKTSKELADFILEKYPEVKKYSSFEIPGNLELTYIVAEALREYCIRLLLSDSQEGKEQGVEILKFINQIMNSDEYDLEAKNMIVLECINGMITDDLKEIEKLQAARKYFTGEALYWLKNNTPSDRDLAQKIVNG